MTNRSLRILARLLLLCAIPGCAICHTPYDETYAAYGGRWQRVDQVHGRVGSVFSDAGAQVLNAGQTAETATELDLFSQPDAPPPAP